MHYPALLPDHRDAYFNAGYGNRTCTNELLFIKPKFSAYSLFCGRTNLELNSAHNQSFSNDLKINAQYAINN